MLARFRAHGAPRRPAGGCPPAGLSCFRWSFPFLGLLDIVLVGLMRHTNCLAS